MAKYKQECIFGIRAVIEAIQQEYRIRVQKMEMAAKDAQRIFMKLKAGEASLPQEVKERLETAYEK